MAVKLKNFERERLRSELFLSKLIAMRVLRELVEEAEKIEGKGCSTLPGLINSVSSITTITKPTYSAWTRRQLTVCSVKS